MKEQKINDLTTKEAKAKLLNYIEEVERLQQKRKHLTAEIAECFGSASNEGFDVKAMKEVLKIRKKNQDQAAIEEDTRELYKDILTKI